MADPGNAPPGGDQNKAPMLRTVISVELSITAMIILMRFYTRIKIVRNPGWDDWIMLATFVSFRRRILPSRLGMYFDLPCRFWQSSAHRLISREWNMESEDTPITLALRQG